MSLNHFHANQLVSPYQWDGKKNWQAEMCNRLLWGALLTMTIEALAEQNEMASSESESTYSASIEPQTGKGTPE